MFINLQNSEHVFQLFLTWHLLCISPWSLFCHSQELVHPHLTSAPTLRRIAFQVKSSPDDCEASTSGLLEDILAFFRAWMRLHLGLSAWTESGWLVLVYCSLSWGQRITKRSSFKSVWPGDESGGDYKGEAVPRDPQCQEGGKLRVRLVKDWGIYLYGLLWTKTSKLGVKSGWDVSQLWSKSCLTALAQC